MTLPIIILAAGASSRMRGADKLLEDVDGVPLIRRQVQIALQVSDDIYVAVPPKPHLRHQALDGSNVSRVEVIDAAEGMSASMRAGFAALKTGTTRAMLLLGDLPEITANDLRQVIDTMHKNPTKRIWRGATEDGAPGHPIIFDHALFADIAMLSGDAGGQSIIQANRDHVQLVPLPDQRARMDLDTPEDWALWRKNR
jgi:CTP:molybdopterin cytidylyltransferase MocA